MPSERRILRCVIYTRKSSEHGLEQDFNSLHAQREAGEAYIKSQAHEGWKLIKTHYDDGGISGGTMDRPALQKLLADITQGLIDVVVVYKVDRLTRSLADFAKLVEIFEARGVSFVSVTQQFNTTTSMGRLTLNVLLSFAQFEREVAGERIRDKFAASRKKGMWMGGHVPLGYDVVDRKLAINRTEADTVRSIFQRYLELGCVSKLRIDLDRRDIRSKKRTSGLGRQRGGGRFSRGALYHLLKNRVYRGEAVHKGVSHPGEHDAILDEALWSEVQTKLASNAGARRKARIDSGALLTGLIFDDRGNRMSPSYTTRKAGRFRYYVSQAVLQGRHSDAGSIRRLSADIVEKLVADALRSPVQDEMDDQASAAQDFSSLAADEGIRSSIRSKVDRIVVSNRKLEITLKKSAGDGREIDEGPRVLHVTLPEKKMPGRKKILIPEAAGAPAYRMDHSFVLMIARGRTWANALCRGEYLDTAAIASQFDLSETYVRRILRLAYLAPDITEAIAEGRQPRSLKLQKLLCPLPLSWPEQRKSLGFSTH
ncbi:MAG TPA: recombinase family protein [Pseudolabrys sp.]